LVGRILANLTNFSFGCRSPLLGLDSVVVV
jgi:hypothetical protein